MGDHPDSSTPTTAGCSSNGSPTPGFATSRDIDWICIRQTAPSRRPGCCEVCTSRSCRRARPSTSRACAARCSTSSSTSASAHRHSGNGTRLCSTTAPVARCTSARAWRTAFQALYEDSTVMYLCSSGYDPDREHTILATDPALDIRWPGTDHVLSGRDAHAPSLEKVKAAGLLPTWEDTKAFVDDLRRRES